MTTYYLPGTLTLWETLGAILIAKSSDTVTLSAPTSEVLELIRASQVSWFLGGDTPTGEQSALPFADAYRMMEDTDQAYPDVLASAAGRMLMVRDFTFPNIEANTGGGIIVAPFGLKAELDLPSGVWRELAKNLRSYDLPVRLLGRRGQRQDGSSYTEGEQLSDLSIEEKLQAIASADLIVGTPNEWMWSASAWKKKQLLFYPEHLPQKRWGWWEGDEFGRIMFQSHQLHVSVILATMNKMINML